MAPHVTLYFSFQVGARQGAERAPVGKPVEVWEDEGGVDDVIVDDFQGAQIVFQTVACKMKSCNI